jgi:soluble lytic murein transglycosylase
LRVREKRDPSPARRQQIARLYLSLDRFDGLYRQGKELVDRKAPSTLPLALYYPPAYFDMVKQLSARYHVPAALLLALVRAESSYDPSARSPAGAIGLTQLLPATARGMMKEVSAGSLTDPALNLSLGARHLRDLLTRYQGDPLPALAAYNAGSTVVDRWLSERKGYDRILLIESIPYLETREYVKKIIAASDIYVRLYPDLSGEVPLVGQFIGKQGTS